MHIIINKDNNIATESVIGKTCDQISIQSIGNSATVHDGLYPRLIFGIYQFSSVDERGNNIYQSNFGKKDLFVYKLHPRNTWVVGSTAL